MGLTSKFHALLLIDDGNQCGMLITFTECLCYVIAIAIDITVAIVIAIGIAITIYIAITDNLVSIIDAVYFVVFILVWIIQFICIQLVCRPNRMSIFLVVVPKDALLNAVSVWRGRNGNQWKGETSVVQ